MIDPEFFLDEEVSKLSPLARLLYVGIWGIVDDNYATFPNRPDWLKVQVFPYEEVDTRRLLDELSSIGKIVLFTAEDGKEYWWVKNFFRHQRIDRPSKSKYPEYKGDLKGSGDSGTSKVDEGSTSTRTETKRSKVKRRERDTSSTEVDSTYDDPRFVFFWKEYPNKKAKGAAWKAWQKLKLGKSEKGNELARRIVESVRAYCKTRDWKKEDGAFIPHPATFLNRRQFDDEITGAKLDTGASSDKYNGL